MERDLSASIAQIPHSVTSHGGSGSRPLAVLEVNGPVLVLPTVRLRNLVRTRIGLEGVTSGLDTGEFDVLGVGDEFHAVLSVRHRWDYAITGVRSVTIINC